jgi:ketosteroid isomerase-like protein
MSQENVEIVKRTYRAIAEHGPEGAFEFVDQHLVVEESGIFPDGRTFIGHTGLVSIFGLYMDTFDDFQLEPQEFLEGTGGEVMVVVRLTGVAKASQVPSELRAFHVHTLREGKIARVLVFLDRQQALEAAGLRE